MTELETRKEELNELMIKGDTLKAIELFYADDVSMQENEEIPRIGKQTCWEKEKQNLQNVNAVYYKLLNQAFDQRNNVVFSEWEIVFHTKSNRILRLVEVSVQHWDQGKVVEEKFYYKDFYPVT